MEESKGQRIAKALSRAGLCSRREAERWIEAGRVKVNGKVLETPATLVSDDDKIEVDGKLIEGKEETRLFRYHKPGGLVTTAKDELGRDTVFDKLPKGLPRVISVGRLDINTEGLLLLTNDGELARYLELPKTGWTRRYRVRAFGEITQEQITELRRGITVDGVKYASIQVEVERQQGANCWMQITLTEGKNREIKRVLEHCGLQVNRLIRTSYGPIQLGKLPKGAVEEVKPHVLREQIPYIAEKHKKQKMEDKVRKKKERLAQRQAQKEALSNAAQNQAGHQTGENKG